MFFLFISCEKEEVTSGTFTDSRDGQLYDWVKIGNQVWMAEDLAYLPQVSGPDLLSAEDPCYYVYGYFGTNVDSAKYKPSYQEYGVLYNWPASMKSCPAGWRLPYDYDWKELELTLGMDKEKADAFSDLNSIRDAYAGGKLKETGNEHWKYKNYLATDEFGFCALPSGIVSTIGQFEVQTRAVAYWTGTDLKEYGAIWRGLFDISGDIARGSERKQIGFAVRCIKR